MSEIEQFQSEDTYEIAGYGTAICVRLPETMSREAIGARYNGKVVEIDGVCYRVKGVESNALPTLSKGAANHSW